MLWNSAASALTPNSPAASQVNWRWRLACRVAVLRWYLIWSSIQARVSIVRRTGSLAASTGGVGVRREISRNARSAHSRLGSLAAE